MDIQDQGFTEQADAPVSSQQETTDSVAEFPGAPSSHREVKSGNAVGGLSILAAAERSISTSNCDEAISPRSQYVPLPPSPLPDPVIADEPAAIINNGSSRRPGRRLSTPIKFDRPAEPRQIPIDRPGRNSGASHTMNERLAADDGTSTETSSIHLSASFASISSTSGERAMFTMDESVPPSPNNPSFGPKTSAEIMYEYALQMNKGRIFLDRSFPSTSPLKPTFFPSTTTKKKKHKRPKLKLSSSAPSRIERGKHERGPHVWSKRKPTGPDDFDLSKAMKNDVMKGGRYDFTPPEE